MSPLLEGGIRSSPLLSIDDQLAVMGISRQPRAYVTLIATPEYDVGAQILVCRLRQFNQHIPIYVLVEESNLLSSKEFYKRMRAVLIQVPNPAYTKTPSSSSIQNETRAGTYTKLQLWNTDNMAEIVAYLDADTYPVRDQLSIFDSIGPNITFGVLAILIMSTQECL